MEASRAVAVDLPVEAVAAVADLPVEVMAAVAEAPQVAAVPKKWYKKSWKKQLSKRKSSKKRPSSKNVCHSVEMASWTYRLVSSVMTAMSSTSTAVQPTVSSSSVEMDSCRHVLVCWVARCLQVLHLVLLDLVQGHSHL